MFFLVCVLMPNLHLAGKKDSVSVCVCVCVCVYVCVCVWLYAHMHMHSCVFIFLLSELRFVKNDNDF